MSQINGSTMLQMAACLAQRYEGSPWYEDRVADIALLMAEAQKDFEPQDGEDTLYRRLVWMLSQAAGRVRKRAEQEKSWAQVTRAISDMIFDDESEDDVWDYITEFHPATAKGITTETLTHPDGAFQMDRKIGAEGYYFRDSNGGVMSVEDIAEIVTKNHGEWATQYVVSALEQFVTSTDWQIPDLVEERQEPEPQEYQVVRGTFSQEQGRIQVDMDSLQTLTVKTFPPDNEVFLEPEEVPEIATYGDIFNPEEGGGDPAADNVDPAWTMLHVGNKLAHAYAQVARRGMDYGRWDSLRTWRYWYANIYHARPDDLPATARRVMAACYPTLADRQLMQAMDELIATVKDYRGSGPLDHGSKRAIVQAIVEEIDVCSRGEADPGAAYNLLRDALSMERYAGAEERCVSVEREALYRLLEARVLDSTMRPAHAIRIAALLDGASPQAASDWMGLVYNRIRTLKEKLDQRAFSWANELRIACTLYPSIHKPLAHRVLVLTQDADKALATLKRLGAEPGKVEIVTIRGSAAEELAQHGYTVTDLTVDARGQFALKWGVGQAAAYATRVWIDPDWHYAGKAGWIASQLVWTDDDGEQHGPKVSRL